MDKLIVILVGAIVLVWGFLAIGDIADCTDQMLRTVPWVRPTEAMFRCSYDYAQNIPQHFKKHVHDLTGK